MQGLGLKHIFSEDTIQPITIILPYYLYTVCRMYNPVLFSDMFMFLMLLYLCSSVLISLARDYQILILPMNQIFVSLICLYLSIFHFIYFIFYLHYFLSSTYFEYDCFYFRDFFSESVFIYLLI